MTEQEQLILDGVLRNEPFICCYDGYAYFLGPDAHTLLNWQYAINWCKSLGDEYELPSKEVLNECYKNKSIRKEFKPYMHWSSTRSEIEDHAWAQGFKSGIRTHDSIHVRFFGVRLVRKIKI